ncbi:MAG: 30S ribosomal protein S6 [Candidatus Omnitrophica bacterium]|nr:30S ribosomal protein S6 [Candidatus Omnitrophota bacterium]
MRNYEAMFLLSPKLTDDKLEQTIATIKDTLEKNEAKIEKMENIGKKMLAYKIKKFKEGIYVLFNFKMHPSSISVVKKSFGLNEVILRTLILLKE